MGEKIKNYEKIKIGEQEFDVELNKSHEKNDSKSIHIQNSKFRLDIPDFEFARVAAAIVYAKKQFDKLKENANE